ncbi:PASTA domain-containing protein [Actinoplanes sp. TRM 88003]|uniref:PASTA domain-containing protein n=1 Tax=Paractinoplanes aksuensis TaxID=2939490 RepID=A0ABT1DG03_9ACTN|nr:PASTA domain-containing protein [Actinoplanes aksuensis]MCO8269768.1 PASTA domain-containing protein [Actinoplanes aksuensis]
MGVRDLFSPARTPRRAGDKIQRGVSVFVVGLLFAMTLVSVLLALASSDGGAGVTAFLLFVAAAAVGAGLGFLFGLPRARAAEASEAAANDGRAATFYLTNSNLIKVSDWLTTIVIGLGLVNLGKVVPSLRSLAGALHDPLGSTAYAGAVGISVLIIGLLAGFILNYLWTSIRVRELLEEAERQNQQTVPDLSNQTLGEAKQAASRSNVTLLVPDGVPDNALVTRQAVPPGATVPSGTAVAVSTVEMPDLRP